MMNAVKTLPAKGRRNGLKILTLGIGLALGILLSTKVCFEQTYDDFYKDASCLHYLSEATMVEGEFTLYDQTSGGIAPRLKEYYPEVEDATRFTWFESYASLILTDTKNRVEAPLVMLADSNFFKVLDRKCLAGRLGPELGVPNNAVISSKMAEKIAGKGKGAASEVIGRQFTIGSRGEDKIMTITGVYEEFPLNASHRPDVLIALPTIGQFMFDGTDEVMGNDRYTTIFRLRKGTDLKAFDENLDGFVKRYLPYQEFSEWGIEFDFTARKYSNYHFDDSDAKNKTLILALVALALLLTSVLNYILIVVSTSVTRSREMALRKCLGSENSDMYKMMFSEAILHTLLAAVFGALLVLAFKDFFSGLIGTDVLALLAGRPLILALITLVIVILVNGIVPAVMFNRIPVASAFRNYRASKRAWKLGLLSVEFGAVSFLGVLICIISLQYSTLMNKDLGFEYKNILEVAIPESNPQEAARVMAEVKKLPFVEDASFGFNSLFNGLSGNMLTLPGENRQITNIRDGYYVDEHYLNTMGIKLIEGRNFTPGLGNDQEVIVDTKFVRTMQISEEWDDVIGKEVIISGHAGPEGNRPATIVGVVDDVYTGNFSEENRIWESRPLAFFYLDNNKLSGNKHYPYIYIRFDKISQEKIAQTTNVISSVVPDQQIYPDALNNKHRYTHMDTMDTRNAILLGSVVALLIAILGLIGYTIDEIKRRSKEIAVRRVNGAQFSSIRKMFIMDIMKIAVPSVVVGCILAAFLARNWEQQFTLQVGLPWWIFVTVAIASLAIIAVISDIYVQMVANTNPAESIKTE